LICIKSYINPEYSKRITRLQILGILGTLGISY